MNRISKKGNRFQISRPILYWLAHHKRQSLFDDVLAAIRWYRLELVGWVKGKGKYKEGGVSIFKLSRKSNNRQIINWLSKKEKSNFFFFLKEMNKKRNKSRYLFQDVLAASGCAGARAGAHNNKMKRRRRKKKTKSSRCCIVSSSSLFTKRNIQHQDGGS